MLQGWRCKGYMYGGSMRKMRLFSGENGIKMLQGRKWQPVECERLTRVLPRKDEEPDIIVCSGHVQLALREVS